MCLEEAQLPSETEKHLMGYQDSAVSSVLQSANKGLALAQIAPLLPSGSLRSAWCLDRQGACEQMLSISPE